MPFRVSRTMALCAAALLPACGSTPTSQPDGSTSSDAGTTPGPDGGSPADGGGTLDAGGTADAGGTLDAGTPPGDGGGFAIVRQFDGASGPGQPACTSGHCDRPEMNAAANGTQV